MAAAPDATTRAAARKIATEGVVALEQGNAQLASQRLEKAFDLLQAPSIALWSARALVKQGKLIEGAERYQLAGRLPVAEGNDQAVQEQAKKDAARELSELTPRIPKLVVTIEPAAPAGTAVTLDGKPIAAALLGEEQQLNPGVHAVVATRGAERVEESVTLTESETRSLVLRLKSTGTAVASAPEKVDGGAADVGPTRDSSPQATATAGSNTRKQLGYVALAAGGAGLVTGAVGGFIALSKRSELDDNPSCRDGKCLPAAQGDVDSFRTMRTVSTIGFIAGGVLGGVGVALLLSGGSNNENGSHRSTNLALHLETSGIRLDGTF